MALPQKAEVVRVEVAPATPQRSGDSMEARAPHPAQRPLPPEELGSSEQAESAPVSESTPVAAGDVTKTTVVEAQEDGPVGVENPAVSEASATTESPVVPESPVIPTTPEGEVEPAKEAPEKAEIDANLATTLGRPKVSNAPTGKLGALLAGRSMLAPDSMNGEGGEGDGLSDTSQLKGAYDHDQVMSAWSDLIQDLRDKNKMGMAATLATGGVTFDDPALKLVVANDVQYEELKECATELLHFLRVKVGNGSIAFEVEVGDEVAAPKFLTPKDRYKHWASENPALEELRVRLDLDLG
ncbi:hypothetical protein OAG26_01250 [Flavobacteriales bacterium]|nr:hypothetical protein [Flavobacteriales bacterium]